MKVCSGCNRTLPTTEFHKGRGRKCKQCAYAASRAWITQNREKARNYAREYERSKRAATLRNVERICAQCSSPIPFERAIGSKYCSRACNAKAVEVRRCARIIEGRRGRLCVQCDREIPTTRTARAVYCSVECARRGTEEHRHHRMCRQLTLYAIKVGRLQAGPCEVCGADDVEVHHVDYFDPLNVRFLCFEHHRTIGHGQVVHKQKELV